MNFRSKLAAEFGDSVKLYAKIQGISQQAISDETGISMSTLSNIYTGKHLASVDKLLLICSALNVEAATLLPDLGWIRENQDEFNYG